MSNSDLALDQIPDPLRALEPQQMATFGHQAGYAGLSAPETRGLVQLIEELSQTAAQQVAFTVTPRLLRFATEVHRNGLFVVAQRIRALPSRLGHTQCVLAAENLANEQPRF